MEGEFVKYINNDGHICERGSEIADKAEVFSHFTYVKSEKQLNGSRHPGHWILIMILKLPAPSYLMMTRKQYCSVLEICQLKLLDSF